MTRPDISGIFEHNTCRESRVLQIYHEALVGAWADSLYLSEPKEGSPLAVFPRP